jgi:hypothetical protein
MVGAGGVTSGATGGAVSTTGAGSGATRLFFRNLRGFLAINCSIDWTQPVRLVANSSRDKTRFSRVLPQPYLV